MLYKNKVRLEILKVGNSKASVKLCHPDFSDTEISTFYEKIFEHYFEAAREALKKSKMSFRVNVKISPAKSEKYIAFSRKTVIKFQNASKEFLEYDLFELKSKNIVKNPKSMTKQRFFPSRNG